MCTIPSIQSFGLREDENVDRQTQNEIYMLSKKPLKENLYGKPMNTYKNHEEQRQCQYVYNL